jgi:hypothetical protein
MTTIAPPVLSDSPMSEPEDELYAQMRFGRDDDATERLGLFVAWLVNHRMFTTELERRAATAVARVRLQDLNGTEFLSTVLNGDLRGSQLSPTGNAFTRAYFVSGRFHEDIDQLEAEQAQKTDPWVRYDRIAPVITKAYADWHREQHPTPLQRLAKIILFRRPRNRR